ncbi:ParA family protein [Hallella mizrahii]|jgi:chromosome partitioning protein|uniref:ParA family protein n=1 Tax=Hallella mizrahii TaxID=2606637 RepID=A0A7K0KJ93_9BACT|nr:ParA family protein [Hallella mizrahii]MST85939.1 ParA family protein [Hallella mizrahii]
MENKIIAFANMKGGVGKSSLCIALANYLTMAKIPVVVVDADLQQTIATLREDEKQEYQDTPEPWRILSLDTSYSNDKEKKNIIEGIKETLAKLKSVPATILIDCPGNASDDAIKYIYNAADVVVVPMDFTRITVNTTKTFAEMLQTMKAAKLMRANVYFQPNKYDERRKQLQRDEVKNMLKTFGYIGTRVNNRSDIERISTYTFPSKLRGFFRFPFEAMTEFIYGKKIIL